MNACWEVPDFGVNHLRRTERPLESLSANHVRVRVLSCSLNYRDLLMVNGHYNPRQPLPLVPLSDGVGMVEELGPNVTRVHVGDRVMGCFAPKWLAGEPQRDWLRSTLGGPLPGMLSQYRDLHEDAVVVAPPSLSVDEAATLPCAALTAWSSLFSLGQLQPGQSVLIQGTGGVSTFALQFAAMTGARTVVISSSDKKLARALEMGATETINYRTHPEWHKRVVELGGADLVVEVGGATTLEQSLRCTNVGGTIALIGVLGGVKTELTLTRVLMSQIRIQGVLVGHRQSFEDMVAAIELNQLKPVVDSAFSFEEAPAAFEYLATGQHLGKVCVRVSDG